MKRILAVMVLVTVMAILLVPTFVFADGDVTSWQSNDTGVFTNLDTKAKGIGAGLFNLVKTIGRIAVCVFMSYLGVRWMSKKSGNDVKDVKDWAVNIGIGAVIFFAANKIVGILFSIGSGF